MKLTSRWLTAASSTVALLTVAGCGQDADLARAPIGPREADALAFLAMYQEKSKAVQESVSQDPAMPKSPQFHTKSATGYFALITPKNWELRKDNVLAGITFSRGNWDVFYWDKKYDSHNNYSNSSIIHLNDEATSESPKEKVANLLAEADKSGISISILAMKDVHGWRAHKAKGHSPIPESYYEFIKNDQGAFLTSQTFGSGELEPETGFSKKLFARRSRDWPGKKEYTLVMDYDGNAGLRGQDGKILGADPYDKNSRKFRFQSGMFIAGNTGYFVMNPWYLSDERKGAAFNPHKAGYGDPVP